MTDRLNPYNAALVSPTELAAVLYDQLDYLLGHSHDGIEEGSSCPDCARLAEVCDALIRPFMSRKGLLELRATNQALS